MTQSTTLPQSLDEMLSLSNARAVYQNQLRLAELKFKNACVLTHNLGEFRLDVPFLAYLTMRLDAGIDRAVILDVHDLPILVDDIEDLLDTANSQYHMALNTYYEEIMRLRSSRKPAKMVEASE